MNTVNGAYIRVLLRYGVGAALFKSTEIGEFLATDPDLVLVLSAVVGLAVEGFYMAAKRLGWKL